MRTSRFEHRFVDRFPDQLEPGVLYVSMPFASATHACACGCGREVVTPLSPVGWHMTFDGKSISIHPSIGNWAFPCRSHYWIKHGVVEWSHDMSNAAIEKGRKRTQAAMDRYYQKQHPAAPPTQPAPKVVLPPGPRKTLWSRFRAWLDEK